MPEGGGFAISLPFVASGRVLTPAQEGRELAIAWIGLSEQCRPSMEIDPLLTQYAMWRVSDILTHTDPPSHMASNGLWTNDNLRRMGVWLPPWYPSGDHANTCESLAWNKRRMEDVLPALLESEAHRCHILGEAWCYYEQCLIGAAWGVNTQREPDEWWTAACLVSAPRRNAWEEEVYALYKGVPVG